MGDLPPIPFEYDNDPAVADAIPSAGALGYVPGAELTIVEADGEVTFMDTDAADDDGITRAWITTSKEGRVYPRDYA